MDCVHVLGTVPALAFVAMPMPMLAQRPPAAVFVPMPMAYDKGNADAYAYVGTILVVFVAMPVPIYACVGRMLACGNVCGYAYAYASTKPLAFVAIRLCLCLCRRNACQRRRL